MDVPTITLATRSHDRTVPLLEGAVSDPTFNFRLIQLPGGHRVMGHGEGFLNGSEFDVTEICFLTYLIAVDQGFPITALPVFPRRAFMQSGWYKNLHAGIESPADLVGKRVGTFSYQTNYSVFAKGDLERFYGVPWKSITWVVPRDAAVPVAPAIVPGDVRLEFAESFDEMVNELIKGDIHALYSPFPRGVLNEGHPNVGPLFAKVRTEEERYLKERGYFPIIHTITLKKDMITRYPELPRVVYNMFSESQRIVRQRWEDFSPWSLLLWGSAELSRQSGLCDYDPWANGVGTNRKCLEDILFYSYEQGATRRLLTVEELFVPFD